VASEPQRKSCLLVKPEAAGGEATAESNSQKEAGNERNS
jgi:hypothetical protein